MKTILISIFIMASFSTYSACGVSIKNQKSVEHYIGYYELETALNKRGYYVRHSEEDSELNIEINFNHIISCSESPSGFVDEVKRIASDMWSDLVDPLASVELKANYSKEDRTVSFRKGMPFFSDNGTRVRRVIRKLLRKIPKCKLPK